MSYLLRYIGEYRKRFFSIFLLLLAGSLIQLVFPFLTQAIVDKGINANNTNLLLLILVAQIILVFSRSMADIIRRKILVTFIQQGQDAHLSLERLAEIQNEDNEDNEIKSKDIPPASPIVIENLVFTYSSALSEKVIKNVTLRIPQGKITVVVGLSGSGKTTLIKLILGFYRPSGGEIKIGDRSLQDINLKEWRRKCGVIMQDGFVFNDTITNNIAPGVEKVDMERVRYAARTANIQEYIESLPLKYNTMIGASGRGLSQGQRQRLLIARAVYKDPAFIFFDEATNALDAKNERTILSNLGVFLKNRTALIVAHRLSTVKNADQIVVLDGGEIVEQGRHSDLVRLQGHYYHLVKDQLELGM
ncbi:MAG: ATP-binding cassette domain-containing protein [Dysgonamonadaceae bacterium]|nr:ATP-binding cassette domain-containing protein [Dysgonamonadaceae bacterium]